MGSRDALIERSTEEVAETVRSSVRMALDMRLGRREKSASLNRFRALEENRLIKLIEQWLNEVERVREPFTVIQSEVTESVWLGELELKIRADRIDRYNDGTHAILDYKTGKVSKDDWEGDRPDAPQLPLYAVTSILDVSEIAFAQMSVKKMQMISEHGAEFQNATEGWRTALRKLSDDFMHGKAEVDPKDGAKTCALCRLETVCRVGEKSALALASPSVTAIPNGDTQ
jgi:ATP-dependent helicase/DNAse subunit B